MPTRADVHRYADANRSIRQLVLAALRALWGSFDLSQPRQVRDALQEAVPLLVAQYGEIAAVVAADFYDDMREQAAAPGVYAAVLAEGPDEDQIRGRIWGAIDSLFQRNPQPDIARTNVELITDELTLQTGRDTITASARLDPAKPRWARVPVGETCAWCLVLASRGAVYATEQTASRTASGGKYHGDCDCTPTPFWPGDPYPDGYNPDALLQQYMDARKKAVNDGKGESTPAILSTFREQQGLAH